jgi:hypothetical protein
MLCSFDFADRSGSCSFIFVYLNSSGQYGWTVHAHTSPFAAYRYDVLYMVVGIV